MQLASSQIAFLVVLTSGLSACVDTHARFEDFEQRVPDAAPPVPEPDGAVLLELPDITGTFLLGLAANIAPDAPFQFLTEVQLDNDRVSLTLTGLDRFDRTPVAGDPLSATDVPVDATGEFQARLQGQISGDANVVTGSDLTVDVTLIGHIRDQDMFCGDVTGMILAPIQLDVAGSTVGAIRVEPGMVGDQLPAPLTSCPQ